jgi:diguanylate cyclase (GGDEF)-like protein
LLIDVDHFKKFNDRYGHPAGDQCLRAIAGVFADAAQRPGDLAARIGGEEFAILMPNTDPIGCKEIGERIRQGVADLNIPHELNIPWRQVTVSIGATIADVRTTRIATSSALVNAADKALYAAKHQGRNRIVIAGELRTVDSAA